VPLRATGHCLHSRYRNFLGGRPPYSCNDAPLITTLLFLLIENLFQSAWWSAQDKDKLELWQVC
jgi:hypothetical protein